jgi:tRNA pseudouridine55 synthase
LNGIINLYKEQGVTSHQAVARARRILGIKKIGHTGTLDPLATGVLPICIGKGTKAAEFLTEGTKTYLATFLLGVATDTEDITGTILETWPVEVGKKQVQEALKGFIGDIEQVPPMYSAVKKDGKKLYQLARAGISIERKPRRVRIDEIILLDNPLLKEHEYQIRVICQKGTYIRTLCADIGKKLGIGATLTSLCREKNGIFTKEDAITIDTLEDLAAQNRIEEVLVSVEKIFEKYPPLYLDEIQTKLVRDGAVLSLERILGGESAQGLMRVYAKDGKFLMLARADQETDQLVRIKGFY